MENLSLKDSLIAVAQPQQQTVSTGKSLMLTTPKNTVCLITCRKVFHFANGATGHWKLAKLTDDRRKLTVDFLLETKGLLGFVMSPTASKKISQASAEITEELKYYLENGKPHPRKLESIKK